MIGERDAFDAPFPTSINPRLKELKCVWADRMPLWVSMVVTIATHENDR